MWVSTFILQVLFKPVFAFGAFFQGNLQFCDKVCPSVGVEGLTDIGPHACSGSKQLVCQDRFVFGVLHGIAYFYMASAKALDLSSSTLAIKMPSRKNFFTIHDYLLLPKNRPRYLVKSEK